jgi:predicted ATPase
MLTKLTLENFKNFRQAELALGPVTTLIGTNASGKSNLRDAFRFLHGIGRGYSLAEIIGEKYESGVLQWSGIRGGIREAAYLQTESFKLTLDSDMYSDLKYTYLIEINPGSEVGPTWVGESLCLNNKERLFNSFYSQKKDIRIEIDKEVLNGNLKNFTMQQPILTQIKDQLLKRLENTDEKRGIDPVAPLLFLTSQVVSELNSIRFFDFDPQALRRSSFPGQTILGDRGENLSSVLQSVCEDSQQKHALLEWIRELTPMDVCDLDFIPDQTGKILLTLVEENGRQTSAYSASDGTLRFLAMLAALLGPKPARLLFFEELENGLHPSRLHLLLQLMERQAAQGEMQIINTTHSPQFLRFLNPAAREYASLTYRLPGSPEGRIRRLLDIPDAQRLIEEQDIANLHESGWFEDAVFLDEAEDAE